MIYLLRKCDIISVLFIRKAYIICVADIIASAISSVNEVNGYHCKNPFCPVDKRGFYMVDVNGLEPLTLCTSSKCSTS